MITYLPLIVLLPPLVVMLLKGRSTWLWWSLAAGIALVSAAVWGTLWLWRSGARGPFDRLLQPTGTGVAYNDTYYVVADFHALWFLAVPALVIGGLLLLPAHPRRYVEYPDAIEQASRISVWITIASLAAILVAAARPVRSAWRIRRSQ